MAFSCAHLHSSGIRWASSLEGQQESQSKEQRSEPRGALQTVLRQLWMKEEPVPVQAIASQPAYRIGGYGKRLPCAPAGWSGFRPARQAKCLPPGGQREGL